MRLVIFLLDGPPIYWTKYWEEGEYDDILPPIEQFQKYADHVKSRFFTMDVAKSKNGDWLIVELGAHRILWV